MKKIIIFALFLVSLNCIAGSHITVGADNDNACAYHNIQDAIDNGGSDTIRIASNKNYFESITINNVSKELIGGYANCSQANLNITDFSTALLTGNGSDDVITINKTNDGSSEVYLKNLLIANGNDGVNVNVQNQAEGIVKLNNVRLINNTAHGIKVFSFNGGNPVVSLEDSIVDFNQNSGVYCSGSAAQIRIGGDSFITDNQAVQSGGGIQVRDGCHADIFSPTIIKDNNAPSNGGGLYVSLNASANVLGVSPQCFHGVCLGEVDAPVVFENNTADSDNQSGGNGGAIAVVGAGADTDVYNAKFINNTAKDGGALSASNGARISAYGYESPGSPCWSSGSCLQFENNKAATGGVAVASGFGAELLLYGAKMTKNLATIGVIGRVTVNGRIVIMNSMIYGNGGLNDDFQNRELFEINGINNANDSTLELYGVTIVDNMVNQQVFDNKAANLSVISTLVFDEKNVYIESGNAADSHFECVIAHENNSFSAGGTVTVIDRTIQPVFVNPMGLNYHLRIDSPAIDYCYAIDTVDSSDIDADARGVDNPDVDDLHGSCDIGADEFHISNDIIFKHGFESD